MEAMAEIDNPDLYPYKDYYDWYTYGDFEGTEAEEEEELLEEKPPSEEESVDLDDSLLFTSPLEAKRAKELAAKQKAKRARLCQLFGLKKRKDDDDVSEDTIITPEEKLSVYDQVSSESSTHPCLREIEISESRLKLQNLFNVYPVPDDPGLAPAFWITEQQVEYTTSEMENFINNAKALKTRPINYLGQMLNTHVVNLRFYGLDSRILKPLSEILEKNVSVHILDLTGNWLTPDACYHLGDLMSKSHVITKFALTGCHIGVEGVKKLVEGLSAAVAVNDIDLDSCQLGNEGFRYLVDAIIINETLECVNLTDNQLTDESAEDLQRLLSGSQTLKTLNLSWNSYHQADTWKMITKGLSVNRILANFNVAWNGLAKECTHSLGIILARGLGLESLNLSGNEFTAEEAVPIGKGLSKNKQLASIYLGNNPLKVEGAFEIVHAVTPDKAPYSNLQLLDLENVWAGKDILPLLEVIENQKPWLEVRLGGILSNYKLVGPDVKHIFLKRAKYEAMKQKRKRRRRNFGHFVLSLGDNPVSKEKFKALVRAFKLTLSKSLVDEIMNAFPGPKRTVDQGFLKSYYLQLYPDTTAPPVKKSKKKRKKGVAKSAQIPVDTKKSKKEPEKVGRDKTQKRRQISRVKLYEDEYEGEYDQYRDIF